MKNILWVLLCSLALLLGYSWGRRSSPAIQAMTQHIDTVYDTITYIQPVPKDSVILRYKTVTVPHVEHITDTTRVQRYDTVHIPIVQKEYDDSSYRAWVSGFEPSLDSIIVFPKTVVVTNTQTRLQRVNNRWGVGIQLGCGYGGNKVSPYIGIGISYNIFTW